MFGVWCTSGSLASYALNSLKLDFRATVNGGNGNGKGSSKLPATIVVQLKMEEIYGWYGP